MTTPDPLDVTRAAIAELRRAGVSVDLAAELVHRVYSAGRDRGLYLAVRGLDSETETAKVAVSCGAV